MYVMSYYSIINCRLSKTREVGSVVADMMSFLVIIVRFRSFDCYENVGDRLHCETVESYRPCLSCRHSRTLHLRWERYQVEPDVWKSL